LGALLDLGKYIPRNSKHALIVSFLERVLFNNKIEGKFSCPSNEKEIFFQRKNCVLSVMGYEVFFSKMIFN